MGDFSAAERVVRQAVETGMIPGAVASAGRGAKVLWREAMGSAQVYGESRPMHKDTVFDLASLTKVVATLPAVLVLVQSGDLSLEAPLSRYFEAFREGDKAQVRIGQLLTHTAGLVPHQPFYAHAKGRQDMIDRVLKEPLAYPPGQQVVYSDLGFIILGALVEKITGTFLATFVEEQVFKPLGMHSTRYCPDSDADIAATEVINGQPKVGIVHDENAEAMDKVAGHAGVFAPAKDLAKYLSLWTADPDEKTPVLGRAVRQRAVLLHTEMAHGRRGWGWVLPGDPQSVTGDLWPQSTAGHTGFTGTSCIFDPISRHWAILLTNRVHFGRQTEIGDLRRRFHNAVAQTLFE
ncbi:MAG: serine hydrolase [Sulfobacillus thermosulfidooxidans]|nr:MAG: serine hydrolase [Sulfobacillus thermosulfidooxidans]